APDLERRALDVRDGPPPRPLATKRRDHRGCSGRDRSRLQTSRAVLTLLSEPVRTLRRATSTVAKNGRTDGWRGDRANTTRPCRRREGSRRPRPVFEPRRALEPRRPRPKTIRKPPQTDRRSRPNRIRTPVTPPRERKARHVRAAERRPALPTPCRAPRRAPDGRRPRLSEVEARRRSARH